MRVDPEMQWIRYLKPSLPDTVWINVLQYERDVVAQVEVSSYSKEGTQILKLIIILTCTQLYM